MNQISWRGFDGGSFQRFCNSLLFSKVSKNAKLYSAPGKDGGIDQYYIGVYEVLSGKWRFQDKFKSTEKQVALSQLRGDVRNDIKDHFNGEDIIVYLTPVDLLPQEEAELEQIAEETFIKLGIAKPATVLIWHHGKLETMINCDPVLYNKFFAYGEPLLQDFREFFGPQVNERDLRYQLGNKFIGRSDDLGKMTAFLDSAETMLVITGYGNIGKTRLVLHFFENYIDANDDWIALVLKPEGYSASSFGKLLLGDRKLIILIDDAHRHLDILASVKTEVDQKKGYVKVILTTRENLFDTVKFALPTQSRKIIPLPLKPLAPIETKEMYRSLLPGQSENNLNWLREKSSGVPGVIVTHCYKIRNSGHPLDIPAEEGFNDFVTELMKQGITSAHEETNLDKRFIREFIQAIALFGPIETGMESMQRLGNILGLEPDELDEIAKSLERARFIIHNKEISIKPAPVSDTILRQALQNSFVRIKKLIVSPDARPYFKNAVNNMAVLDIPGTDGARLINDLLNQYIAEIKNPDATEEDIRAVLYTLTGLSFRLPEITVTALHHFIEVNGDKDHALHQKQYFETETPLQRLQKDAARLLGRIMRSEGDRAILDKHFNLFQQCFKDFDGLNVMYPCFGYTEFDFETSKLQVGPCCYRQLYLMDKIDAYFISDAPTEWTLAIAAYECLFKHDYMLEESYDPYKMEISGGEGFLPNCSHVQYIRLQLLKGVIQHDRKHRLLALTDRKYMNEIARVLLYMYDNGHKKQIIDQTAEMDLVKDYFLEILRDNPSMEERALIARYLKLGRKRELKTKFNIHFSALMSLLEPDDPEKKLELFLTSIDHFSEERDNLQRVFNAFSGIDEFIDTVKQILTRNSHLQPSPLNDLSHFLGKQWLRHGLDLFNFVIDTKPEYIPNLSNIADYLTGEKKTFDKIVKKIWDLPQPNSFRSTVIFMLLSKPRIENEDFEAADLDKIEWAIMYGESQSRNTLSYHLYRYADVDTHRTFDLLLKFAALPERPGSDIIHSICKDKEFCQRYKEPLLSFFESLREWVAPTSLYFSPALIFVQENFGEKSLFAFVTDFCRKKSELDDYLMEVGLYAPPHTFEERCELFLSYLRWLSAYSCPLKDYMRKRLIAFFVPPLPLKKEDNNMIIFQNTFKGLINKAKTCTEFETISISLQVYYPYNRETLLLQCAVIDRYLAELQSTFNIENLLGGEFIDNREVSKSGRPGYPYVQDLQKEAFLTEFLTKETLSEPMRALLHRCLLKVREDMRDTSGKITWQ